MKKKKKALLGKLNHHSVSQRQRKSSQGKGSEKELASNVRRPVFRLGHGPESFSLASQPLCDGEVTRHQFTSNVQTFCLLLTMDFPVVVWWSLIGVNYNEP